MPIIKLSDACTRQVSHPSERRLLKPGESADASDLWVRQHTPLVRSGEIEVSAGKPKKAADDDQCKAKTKSGKRCKRTATDGDYCTTHAD